MRGSINRERAASTPACAPVDPTDADTLQTRVAQMPLPQPVPCDQGTEPTPLAAPDIPDEELMMRLQYDSAAGIEELFRRYSRMTFCIAFRILHDRGEAEELVQDVFLYVFQKRNHFDPARGTAKGWILHITYHRALDRKAYLRRRAFYTSADVLDERIGLRGSADTEKMVGDLEDFNLVQNAFGSLTQAQRSTVLLHYFGGLELREIAVQLNESLGNVRHYLYRGLKRLRENPAVKLCKPELEDHRRATKTSWGLVHK